MDAFIKSFSDLSTELMPILGAVALVCLIILLIRVIKVLTTVDSTLLKAHTTIDLVDESINKVQAPLNTVVKISGSVDKAHDATVKAVETTKDFVAKNAAEIKDKVSSILNGEDSQELKQPNPEDVIGE